MVHFFVRTITTVNSNDEGLATIRARVQHRPTERLCPVSGKPLNVLRVVAVAEGMTHHLVREHSLVPGLSQLSQRVVPPDRFVDGLHALGVRRRLSRHWR